MRTVNLLNVVIVAASAATLLPREDSFASTLKPCTGAVKQYNNCFATSTSSDGRTYTGEWRNGLPDGEGELILDGYRHLGSFSKGSAEGLAIVHYPNAKKHVGYYRDGKPDGVFLIYGPDGSTVNVEVYNASQVDPMTTSALGESLAEAMGAAKLSDFETAYDIWMPLAESGNAEAQYNIAIMNEHGEGIPVDLSAARKWMKRAAHQYHPMAQYFLGVYSENGIGGKKNEQEAYKWKELAAENGVVDAQRELAIKLKNGIGVSKNVKQAMYWYSRAALNNDRSSAIELATDFAKGTKSNTDKLTAYQWYYIATGYDGSDGPRVLRRENDYLLTINELNFAQNALQLLSNQLTKSQIAKAKQQADRCLLEESVDAAFTTCGIDIFR